MLLNRVGRVMGQVGAVGKTLDQKEVLRGTSQHHWLPWVVSDLALTIAALGVPQTPEPEDRTQPFRYRPISC
jgi:hypothetical protein